MFSDDELKTYQNEFRKINKNLNLDEIKSILDFFYTLGAIAYNQK